MAENKSSISNKSSYVEIGEFWDSHDLTELVPDGGDVPFDIDLGSDVHYYAVDDSLSTKLHTIAETKGISTEMLVNVWLSERADIEVAKQ